MPIVDYYCMELKTSGTWEQVGFEIGYTKEIKGGNQVSFSPMLTLWKYRKYYTFPYLNDVLVTWIMCFSRKTEIKSY